MEDKNRIKNENVVMRIMPVINTIMAVVAPKINKRPGLIRVALLNKLKSL